MLWKSACFQKFEDNISEARRAGDADTEKKIVAETRKLDGNSSYGKTFINKVRHTDAIYCQEHQVSRYLFDPYFRRCNQLSAKTFEVEMSTGLFKTEFTGDGMVALCNKTYFCFGVEDKFSCK